MFNIIQLLQISTLLRFEERSWDDLSVNDKDRQKFCFHVINSLHQKKLHFI